MLTLKEKLVDQCIRSGMSAGAAMATVEAATPEINATDLNHNVQWDFPWDGYPTQLVSVWMIIVNRHGVAWIDANVPGAWYREMFLP